MNPTGARIVHEHFAFEGYLKSPPGYAIEPYSPSLAPPHSPSGLPQVHQSSFGTHEHVKLSTPFKAHVAPSRHVAWSMSYAPFRHVTWLMSHVALRLGPCHMDYLHKDQMQLDNYRRNILEGSYFRY